MGIAGTLGVGLLGVGLAGVGTPALAYDWTRTCLDIPSDQGFALKVAVGPDGEVHLARIQRVLGNLMHSRVAPDGQVTSSQVAAGISNFGVTEVKALDIEIFGGVPHLCHYEVRADRISVAIGSGQPGGGFTSEVVFAGPGARDGCALFSVGGRVGVAYNTAEGLQVALRVGPNQWASETVDRGRIGLEVDAATLDNGEVVLAHREEPGWELRLSVRGLNGAWRTFVAPRFGPEWGQSPSIVPGTLGTWRVYHGVRPMDSDNGVVRSAVTAAGRVDSAIVSGADAVGGTLAAGDFVEGEAVLARELRRSALFGATDGLQFYDAAGRDTLASHSAAEQRHRYQFLNARRDPFGLPVLGVYVERSPFAGQQAGAFICLWRPTDTDADRVPDSEEARIGTRIDVADTDGDGVSDGIEYLVDRTDPRGPGELPPLDAGPLPDVGVGLDAFVPPADMAPRNDAAPPQDQGQPPADRGPTPDATLDQGLRDVGGDAEAETDGAPPGDGGEPADGGEPGDGARDGGTEDQGPGEDGAVEDRGGPDARPPRDARPPQPDADDRPQDFGRVDARPPRTDAGLTEDTAAEPGGCAVTADANPSAPGAGWALAGLLGLLVRRRRRLGATAP